MSSDYRKLLPSTCFECVIDVVGWKEFDPNGGWDHGSINIGVHSNHVAIWRQSMRQRIARAWTALRNEDPEGYLDFPQPGGRRQFHRFAERGARGMLPAGVASRGGWR